MATNIGGNMQIEVFVADYSDINHANDLVLLLDDYANDPMGGNEPLPDAVRNNIVNALNKIPHAFSVLCYVDGKPAGFANCFEAFSTFKCLPLINIHDLAVKSEYRGMHLSQIIIEKIEAIACNRGCCKITLEVLDGNKPARQAYHKCGFSPYQLDDNNGTAQFWQKILTKI